MSWTPVTSSNVAAIDYSDDTETLMVKFLDGSVYHYFHVPKSHYRGLLNAGSVGGYLARHIKGAYRYQKIG